ncbi:O-antigen ligase family protein [Patescibacteria group bacterium]
MQLEKICKSIIYGGIFLIPFLAFIVAQSMFFPFITGKNFAFRVVVEIIFAAWVLLALYRPQYRLRMSGIGIAIAAFLSIMFIANIFGENISRSFWSNYERMEGFVTLLHLGAYFTVLASVLKTEKIWNWLLHTTLGANVIMGLYGFSQLAGNTVINQGGDRLDATFGNATYFAIYALFHIFIALFLFVRRKGVIGGWMKSFYVGTILLNLIMLYNTATRGAMLGLIGGAFLMTLIIAVFEKENVKLRKISAGLLFGIVAFIGIFLGIKNTSFVQESPVLNRFANISLQDNTTKARFMIWDMAYEGWKEQPILGWGQENFNLVFSKHYKPEMYAQEPFFDRAHNVFLDWLVAGGVLGLLAYLSIFLAALHCLWRMKSGNFSFLEKTVLTGMLAAYFSQNLFVFDNIFSYILFFTMLAYIHTQVTNNAPEKEPRALSVPAHIVAPILIVAAALTLYSVNVKGFLTNKAIISGMSPQEGGVSENIAYFKKAIAYDTFGKAEAREHLTQTARRVMGLQQVPEAQKQEFAELARREMVLHVEEVPNDVRNMLFAGSYFRSIGLYDDAIVYLEKALELSPKKQQIFFELISVYLSKGDYEKAVQVAKEAYELETTYENALKIYAATAIYAGNLTLAEELLMPKYGTMIIDDDGILNAFAAIGNYESVIQIWEKRITDLNAQGQDNPQHHLSLAATYLQVGKRQSAISEIQKVIELNPEFKDQGEYYINEIRAGRNP